METSGYTVAPMYSDLREKALGLKSDITGTDAGEITALLMETGFPGAVITLVVVEDGSVSLYFSNGGGIIGAGEHESVRAARDFLAVAGEYLPQATRADDFPLPAVDRVRFWFVTDQGIRMAEAAEDDLGYERHPFSRLFFAGHEVIAAVRENTPQ